MEQKIKSILIAILYPGLYFACQLLVQVVALRLLAYQYGEQNGLTHMVSEKMYTITLGAGILCFLILLLFSIIKKQNLFENYKKISLRKIITYMTAAIGLYAIIVLLNGFLIQFFPDYGSQMDGLFQIDQPFLAIMTIGIVAPLIEELIFRGEAFRVLEKSFSGPMVILLQAILFGAVHAFPLQKIQTFIMGLVFGYVRSKTDSIWPPTIMHITSNMIACLLVFVVL